MWIGAPVGVKTHHTFAFTSMTEWLAIFMWVIKTIVQRPAVVPDFRVVDVAEQAKGGATEAAFVDMQPDLNAVATSRNSVTDF